MLENDSTDSARERKRKSPVPAAPLMVAGALYSLAQLMDTLGVSDRTIAKWKDAGLKLRQPSTHTAFVFSDDVFEVIRKLTDEEPP